MGAAWLDLRSGADVDEVLLALRDGEPYDEPAELAAWVREVPGGRRVEVFADDGFAGLGTLVVDAMRATGTVRRAMVVLDLDEYGAEQIVLAPIGGLVRRVHHLRVGDQDPALSDVPPADPNEDPRAVLDGVAARLSVARLYGVPMEKLEKAATLAEWRAALELPWVGTSGEQRITLRPSR